MKGKVGIGIIGAGYWGKKLIGEYAKLTEDRQDVTLIGVADTLSRNREIIKQEYGVETVDNYRALLDNKDVHAVHIATPNETHYRIGKDSLEAGKHTLLEKPMTKSSKEAFELEELARERGLVLQVGHIFRFNSSVRKVRDYVQGGQIGKVYDAKLSWTTSQFPLPIENDIIFDLAPHPIDILNFVYGEWPLRVYSNAESFVRCRPNLEEWAFLTLDYSDRKKAIVELSWIDPKEKRREVQVDGSFATIVADTSNQKVNLYGYGKKVEIPIEVNNAMGDEASNFVDSIQRGTPSTNSGHVGAKTVEVLEALRQSLDMGVPLEIGGIEAKVSKNSSVKSCKVGENTEIRDYANLYGCRIGDDCKISSFVYIEEDVDIGNRVKIKPLTFIPSGVTIEDDVFVGPNVSFTNDKYPRSYGDWKLLKTIVKKGASIGAGAEILPSIVIGEGALVGAGSVVTKDVPSYAKVAGNPARIIGYMKDFSGDEK